MKEYEKSDPLFNSKRIAEQHSSWIRSVYVSPTTKQQALLNWLLTTNVKIQRKYVIIEDSLVESPTNIKRYEKRQHKWVQTYPFNK